jgi:endonuclease I
MKKYLLILFLMVSQLAFATISNGDFENFTNDEPDDWSTIDSGISVSESSTAYSGNSSVSITVNTTTQASTDFRQSVEVTSGETYDFSVWVYHTEGNVTARLYIDGYQGYSSNSLTYQWQELSYSYTATATETIEVGLRFYDQSGFDGSEEVLVDLFEPTDSSDSDSTSDSDSSASYSDLSDYYASAEGLTGYDLKTALYYIINEHSTQSYSSLWTFYSSYDFDDYYENDGTILDIYSENASGTDPYNFTASSDQCGTYSSEGDCYNREHAFPRSWFGGAVSPMNTDVHHIFPTDGKVNGYRSSYPYGEVSSATYTSENGSKLGSGSSGLGYTGTVFEPIDEFKGDVARAYFYMATRYEDQIDDWEDNSTYGDAVLDGSTDQVFEDWALEMLLDWHESDPVSQKELDRNEAAYSYQGNRNPFIDYPDFVTDIWGD